MKKTKIFFLTVLVAMALAACGGGSKTSSTDADSTIKEMEADFEGMKSYVLKAIISAGEEDYKFTNTMTIWADIENDRSASELESVIESFGQKQTTKMLYIEEGEWTYAINLKTNTGTKMTSDNEEFDFFDREMIDDDITFRQMIEEEGGRIVENETILGKNCIVVETIDDDGYEETLTKIWYYKGLPLKMVSDQMTMEVTHFEENTSIPADKFKVPSGVTIR